MECSAVMRAGCSNSHRLEVLAGCRSSQATQGEPRQLRCCFFVCSAVALNSSKAHNNSASTAAQSILTLKLPKDRWQLLFAPFYAI